MPILSFRSGRGTASHQCFERVFRNGFQRKNQLTEEIARRHKNKASLSLVYLALHSAKLMWPKLDEPNNAMLRAECYTGTLRFLGASNEAVFEGLLHLQDNSAIAVFRQLLFDGQSNSDPDDWMTSFITAKQVTETGWWFQHVFRLWYWKACEVRAAFLLGQHAVRRIAEASNDVLILQDRSQLGMQLILRTWTPPAHETQIRKLTCLSVWERFWSRSRNSSCTYTTFRTFSTTQTLLVLAMILWSGIEKCINT